MTHVLLTIIAKTKGFRLRTELRIAQGCGSARSLPTGLAAGWSALGSKSARA